MRNHLRLLRECCRACDFGKLESWPICEIGRGGATHSLPSAYSGCSLRPRIENI
jgi:hypothetical protein